MATRTITIKFNGDVKGLEDAAQRGGKSVDGWKSKFQKWNKVAVAASTGVIVAAAKVAKDFVGLASQAEQSLGAVDSVFGDSANQVKAWADQAAESVGLSAHSYRELATITGAQLKNMGIAQDEVAERTNNLVKLGADLAATFGGPTSQAVEAIGSLLRGETDPIERYGVSIKQADINARLAAEGLSNLEGAELKEAQAKAALALLTEQTAAAQGQFARETGTAAGQAQIAQAQWENIRTELGQRLLPAYTAVAGFITGTVLPVIAENQDLVTVLGVALVSLAGFVLAANAAWKVYDATKKVVILTTKAMTVAQKALNVAMRSNPIGLVITVLGLLVGAIVAAYQKSETFRNIVQSVWRGIQTAVSSVWNNVLKPVLKWFQDLPRKIKSAWSGLSSAISAPFRAGFQAVRAFWNSTIGGKGFDIPSWVPGIGGKSFRIPRLATGGIALAGMPHIVGERGPELFIPDRTGLVVPNHQLGGGPIVIENHIEIGGEVVRVTRREISEHDRALKRGVLAGVGAA